MIDEVSCIGRKKCFAHRAAGVCMEGFSRVRNIMFLPSRYLNLCLSHKQIMNDSSIYFLILKLRAQRCCLWVTSHSLVIAVFDHQATRQRDLRKPTAWL